VKPNYQRLLGPSIPENTQEDEEEDDDGNFIIKNHDPDRAVSPEQF
jgi:hypothetical protein